MKRPTHKKKSQTFFILAVICFGIVMLQSFNDEEPKNEQPKEHAVAQIKVPQKSSNKLELAKTQNGRSSQIIEHKGYTVDYNKDFRIPNWVAYCLTHDELLNGNVERSDKFLADPEASGVVISTDDYKFSGYDRGHMAPAADMKWDKTAMQESFYLSNICPQNHNLNAGDWKILEERVRDWAKNFSEVYVVCGPFIDEYPETIGQNKIAVPSGFFKVVLMNTPYGFEAVGFTFENEAGHHPLSEYMVSVDKVEEFTGIDFFYNLPDSIETEVERGFTAYVWEETYED